MNTPTFLYTVDCYGPHGSRESGGYLHGPSGLPRGEALEHLTDRMRDLAGGAAPPEGWSEWGSLAVHLLDKADENPETGQDQIVRSTETRTFGVVATAEPLPVVEVGELRKMATAAREEMEPGLNDLFRQTVSNVVDHQDWPGDVDPPTVHRLNEALEGALTRALEDTLAQLIENGLEQRPGSEQET